jgi:hypothetical protein
MVWCRNSVKRHKWNIDDGIDPDNFLQANKQGSNIDYLVNCNGPLPPYAQCAQALVCPKLFQKQNSHFDTFVINFSSSTTTSCQLLKKLCHFQWCDCNPYGGRQKHIQAFSAKEQV